MSFSSTSQQTESFRDTLSIAGRIYGRGSVLLQSSGNSSLKIMTDEIISSLSIRTEKSSCFQVLASMIRSKQYDAFEGVILSIIDSMPGTIESSCSTKDSIGTSDLFLAILESGSSDMHNRIAAILSKVVNSCLRNIQKDCSCTLAFDVLEGLAVENTPLRSSLLMHTNATLLALTELLQYPIAFERVARCLATLYSLLNAESWGVKWSAHCDHLVESVTSIGIHAGSVLANAAVSDLSLVRASKQAGGHSKALAVERRFRGHCEVLKQMLEIGCSGGACKLNLSVLVGLSASVLPLHLDSSASNSKYLIENEFGVAPADLCVVSSQLKIHLLSVVKSLLQTQDGAFIRCANALFSPISSLLASDECIRIPSLGRGLVDCVALAARTLPTMVSRSALPNARGGVNVIIELLKKEVAFLTSPRTSVISDSTVYCSRDRGRDHIGPMPLLTCCESLLLFCGPFLPSGCRADIEGIVGAALVCMSLGCLPPLIATDRRVKRSSSELLRCSPDIQNLILRVAVAEVISPTPDSLLSGNASLLLRASQSCLRQPETAVEATRALLLVNSLLHPTALTLPSLSAVSFASKSLRASLASREDVAASQSETLSSEVLDPSTLHKRTFRNEDGIDDCMQAKKRYSTVDEFKPEQSGPVEVSSPYLTKSMADVQDLKVDYSSAVATSVQAREEDDEDDELPSIF